MIIEKYIQYPIQTATPKLKTISITLITLHVLDLLTTAIGLSMGGQETNIIVNQYGWFLFLLIKILYIFIAIFIFEHVKSRHFYFFWLLNLYALIVVIWNIGQITIMI